MSLLTRWAKELPDVPFSEHPRPTHTRESWLNLNGRWRYKITPNNEPMTDKTTDHWDGDILVPFCIESELSGVQRQLLPDQRLWYQRDFELATVAARTLLHFGAVDYECAIWINGAFAGAHSGGFDAFTIDITAYAREGTNSIRIGVNDATSRGDQPRGKQHLKPNGIWYTAVSGIWQTVWIEQVAATAHIEEIRITPLLEQKAVDVVTFLHRPTRDPNLAVRLVVTLNSTEVTQVIARPDRQIRIPIDNPQLWTPDAPVLYDITAELIGIDDPLPAEETSNSIERRTPLRGPTESALYANAKPQDAPVIDRVQSYFGMRSIELGPHPDHNQPTLLLNGQPVFHLGTLDQGWWPDGLHTPPSDAAIVDELEFLKASGFNTLRKHIKVEPARFYYHCDRLGLLVWQDMPSGFLPAQFVAANDEAEALRHSRSSDTFEIELQRMIRVLAHHPSIVVWVLHNEGWGQFDTKALTERIRGLDPTRLICASSGWLDVGAGDMIDKHDYSPKPTPPNPDGKRALVMGEYGGAGWPVEGHQWDPSLRNWGYQTYHTREALQAAYQEFTTAIINMHHTHGLCAAIYTQTSDVEAEVNGLLTYDRSIEKLPRDWLRQVHAELPTHTR